MSQSGSKPTDSACLDRSSVMRSISIPTACSEAIVPAMSDEEIRGLKAPTYLLVGQYEAAMNPYKVIERGLRLLPNVVIAEIVPGVGHSMIHRQPDWMIARVMNFLERYAV